MQELRGCFRSPRDTQKCSHTELLTLRFGGPYLTRQSGLVLLGQALHRFGQGQRVQRHAKPIGMLRLFVRRVKSYDPASECDTVLNYLRMSHRLDLNTGIGIRAKMLNDLDLHKKCPKWY
jgi:hypothetical protein